MCNEVDWLKDTLFSKLQHYPVYGIVQCCRLSDVADKLDNFPKSVDVPADLKLPRNIDEIVESVSQDFSAKHQNPF